jgi:hypothetical protein
LATTIILPCGEFWSFATQIADRLREGKSPFQKLALIRRFDSLEQSPYTRMTDLLSNRSLSVRILASIILVGVTFGLPAARAIELSGIQEQLKQPVQSQPSKGTAAVVSPAAKEFAAAGFITGRVILTAKAPRERTINLDPSSRQLKNAPTTTRFFVTSQDGGLADVFVVVTDGLPVRVWPGAEKPSVLHISGCFYEPYVSAVRAGQEIQIVNREAVLHNALVSPNKSKDYNFAIFPKETRSMRIPEPELFVQVRCDVHPWEIGYINVVDHPYYAMTDADGRFKLPSLAPGKYKVKAYHRLCGELSQEVEIGIGEPSPIEFRFKAATKSFAQSGKPGRAGSVD